MHQEIIIHLKLQPYYLLKIHRMHPVFVFCSKCTFEIALGSYGSKRNGVFFYDYQLNTYKLIRAIRGTDISIQLLIINM